MHKSVLGLDLHVGLLIEQNPDCAIDEKDVHGQTALYWAALRADVQAVSYLLRAGADGNTKNRRGAGILTAALISQEASCVHKILGISNDINYRDADGYTPLHHSCRYSLDVKIVKTLLDRGADRDAKTGLGHSALMIAAFNKRTAAAKLLIDSQVDLNIQGKDGGCALHHAVMVGDHDVVGYLLKHQANHWVKTSTNETLLHFVAQRSGDQDMIRILESFNLKGIDIEAKNQPQQLTALQVAERHKDCDTLWLRLFRALMFKIKLGNFYQ